jgi:hypothetical protein
MDTIKPIHITQIDHKVRNDVDAKNWLSLTYGHVVDSISSEYDDIKAKLFGRNFDDDVKNIHNDPNETHRLQQMAKILSAAAHKIKDITTSPLGRQVISFILTIALEILIEPEAPFLVPFISILVDELITGNSFQEAFATFANNKDVVKAAATSTVDKIGKGNFNTGTEKLHSMTTKFSINGGKLRRRRNSPHHIKKRRSSSKKKRRPSSKKKRRSSSKKKRRPSSKKKRSSLKKYR